MYPVMASTLDTIKMIAKRYDAKVGGIRLGCYDHEDPRTGKKVQARASISIYNYTWSGAISMRDSAMKIPGVTQAITSGDAEKYGSEMRYATVVFFNGKY